MPATSAMPLPAREFDRIGVDGIASIAFFIWATQDGLIRQFSGTR